MDALRGRWGWKGEEGRDKEKIRGEKNINPVKRGPYMNHTI
jgi:hypothetical protein